MSVHDVLVVEDDPNTRAHLAAAVVAHPSLSLAGTAGSVAEARALLAQHLPRVMLVDLGLPDGDGTALIRDFSAHPRCDAMVVTVFGDERHVVGALEAGATGYLLKDSPLEDIAGSILRLVAGDSPISPRIASYLVRRFHKPDAAAPQKETAPTLTEREREVLDVMARGFSYAEVASALALSPHTVGSHIKAIYRKLAVGSRGAAVFEATSLGLIRPGG